MDFWTMDPVQRFTSAGESERCLWIPRLSHSLIILVNFATFHVGESESWWRGNWLTVITKMVGWGGERSDWARVWKWLPGLILEVSVNYDVYLCRMSKQYGGGRDEVRWERLAQRRSCRYAVDKCDILTRARQNGWERNNWEKGYFLEEKKKM